MFFLGIPFEPPRAAITAKITIAPHFRLEITLTKSIETLQKPHYSLNRGHPPKNSYLKQVPKLNPSTPSCPKCGSINFYKNGHDKYGNQQFLCKDCNHSFRLSHSHMHANSTISELATFITTS
ncbi:IS1/IS1595 family N-terminal zinc-binding domain-containing protein [Fervidobacterium sp.]